MTERRRRNGDDDRPGRVHGAWATPAVVVRGPDGSVLDGDDRPERPAQDGTDAGDRRAEPSRQRLRPRRIPGAPGAVLLSPTLSSAERSPVGRLVRNTGEATAASPLPPRPPASVTPIRRRTEDRPAERPPIVAGDEGGTAPTGERTEDAGDGGASDREQRSTASGTTGASRPTLAVVGAAIDRSGVRRAWQGGVARLVPDDPEARAERLARLYRVGVGAVAAVVAVLIVYTVFPVRTALDIWQAEDRARERREAFDREIEILEEEVDDLQTDERIEVEARQLGMVKDGEESYGIMPAPSAPEGSAAPTTSTTVPDD